ncbi:hypothetical protein ACWET9_23665 [Streptomyces sp. NPDC004059]
MTTPPPCCWPAGGRPSWRSRFARGAGAHTTLRWLAFVTLVAVVLVVPAVALLYWLDTHGELEGLSDADLRDDAVDEV